jgi:hypothetical protein
VLALVPNIGVAALLWGDPTIAVDLLVRPLPLAAAWALLLAFPIAIGLSELPVYFGYVLPRLRRHVGGRVPAILVTAAVLSLQHVTLPLVFDWRFVVWRAVVFLPFALLLAVVLDKRPRPSLRGSPTARGAGAQVRSCPTVERAPRTHARRG